MENYKQKKIDLEKKYNEDLLKLKNNRDNEIKKLQEELKKDLDKLKKEYNEDIINCNNKLDSICWKLENKKNGKAFICLTFDTGKVIKFNTTKKFRDTIEKWMF